MVAASQIRAGMAIRFDGQDWKVLVATYHPGQGKMGGVLHARLLNLSTGTQWEHSLRGDLKVEELPLERKPMQFLYDDGLHCVFLDADGAAQAEVPRGLLAGRESWLLPEMTVTVEFLHDRPVSVVWPDYLELCVADTAPPAHQSGPDTTWKPATLENGLEVQVPPFIKPGDRIRIGLPSLKYMDRAKLPAR